MPEQLKIISRAEVFEHVARVGRAALAGEPTREMFTSTDHMRAEDLKDAQASFVRTVAEGLDRVPELLANNVDDQEAIRTYLDQVVADATQAMRRTDK